MNSKKYLYRKFIFVFIVLSIFSAPFIFRLVAFVNALNVYDYQEIPSTPKQGDKVKTVLTINEDFHVNLFRESHFTYFKAYKRIERIVEYSPLPHAITLIDENNKNLILETPDKKIFNKILDSNKPRETIDSFTLYMPVSKNGNYTFYEIENYNGDISSGNKIDSTTVHQFFLNDLSHDIIERNPPSVMNYKQLVALQAPALLYSHQKETKGLTIFGSFKITNINPLTVKCVEYISHKHPNELKKDIWRRWFSGFELVEWIGFGLPFCVSLFFIFKQLHYKILQS